MDQRTTVSTPAPRSPFPAEGLVLTDAGLETWLVFHHGVDLPAFAAYPLAGTEEGRRLLDAYYRPFLAIAAEAGAGLELEAPTWRANPDWAVTLGHDTDTQVSLIDASVEAVAGLRAEWADTGPFLVGGAVGPRGDGYRLGAAMSVDEAAAYHAPAIARMAAAGVDLVTAMTIGYVDEAAGIVEAAQAAGVPVVVSFTVETDGRLPSGQRLGAAIEACDAATGAGPVHYMINCAHPTHLSPGLEPGATWMGRIGGLRANASTLSHAELDEADVLDDGDPVALAEQYVALRDALPGLRVLGGCCGTDHRHVAAIATACTH